jgi:hypothetical protein
MPSGGLFPNQLGQPTSFTQGCCTRRSRCSAGAPPATPTVRPQQAFLRGCRVETQSVNRQSAEALDTAESALKPRLSATRNVAIRQSCAKSGELKKINAANDAAIRGNGDGDADRRILCSSGRAATTTASHRRTLAESRAHCRRGDVTSLVISGRIWINRGRQD